MEGKKRVSDGSYVVDTGASGENLSGSRTTTYRYYSHAFEHSLRNSCTGYCGIKIDGLRSIQILATKLTSF